MKRILFSFIFLAAPFALTASAAEEETAPGLPVETASPLCSFQH
jgi:hypothetical protein